MTSLAKETANPFEGPLRPAPPILRPSIRLSPNASARLEVAASGFKQANRPERLSKSSQMASVQEVLHTVFP